MASQLVDMALAEYVLGVSDDGTPYGTHLPPDASHVAMPLRGGKLGLRAELARRYFLKHNTVPGGQALADACTVLEGYAAQESPRALHLRVAAQSGRVYIDMADDRDRVIVIGDGRWSIVDAAPVLFRRTALTAALPEPRCGGDISALWQFVNIAEEDRALLLAALVAALIQPDAPHVILGLLAEHGSAKSTATRIIVSLVDPSVAPLRMPPRDIDNWVTAANGSWVVALDNVSSVPPWLSDALCRAATGDALPKRALYTDADIAVLRFRRSVILNGIDLGGLRGDLSDRLALVSLQRITTAARRDETQLAQEWRQHQPAVLGGLLDLAAQVHHLLPAIVVDGGLPRMADFAKVLACVDQILGTPGLARYRERSTHLAADSVAAESFSAELQRRGMEFTDRTSAELLAALKPADPSWRPPRDWPRNARSATTQLMRHAPALRALGWHIGHDGGRTKDGITRWTITPPDESQECSPPDPPDPPAQVNGHKSGGSNLGLFPATDPHSPPGGSGGEPAGQPDSSDPPKNMPLNSEDGAAGQAGQKPKQSLVYDAACRYCGAELRLPAATARGYCSRPACLSTHREQTSGVDQ